jgi:hypothetical protein
MKKVFFTLMFLCAMPFVFSQTETKNDIIEKLNGDELTVKILEVGDDVIKFSYPGETVTYTLKKSEIFKIKFGSGRVEVITKPGTAPSSPAATAAAPASAASLTTTTAAERKNKVAILPIIMIRDGQNTSEEITFKIQNEVYNYMSSHTAGKTILDPRTTNAILAKAGINRETVRNYTMDELGDIVGAEYLVEGLVTLDQENQTSTSNTQYNTTTKNDPKKNNTDYNTTKTSTSTTEQNYSTRFNLSIYDDKGNSVFNQQRKSFWDGQNAYRNAMEYLLKRTPLYTK